MVSYMQLSQFFHRFYPVFKLLPNKLQMKLMSVGRYKFMQSFANYVPQHQFVPATKHEVKVWGLTFRSPLMNSAGMFKNGECYDAVATLGAGGYIGGTSTVNQRVGNTKNGVELPFITLPHSKISVNWLGLPNLGDDILSHKIITNNKIDGCPIGWSVMRSPDYDEDVGLKLLIESLWKYHDNSQIDFIEINESCPNIKTGGGNIISRLKVIAEQFLWQRKRNFPVVVKLSNDITTATLGEILRELINLDYDGINLGNTSTNYESIQRQLVANEVALFKEFTTSFGGGVGGVVLKASSLNLCSKAVQIVKEMQPKHEFHVIRSGGVESSHDVAESLAVGVSLVQWYTGFFTAFNACGDSVYREVFEAYS